MTTAPVNTAAARSQPALADPSPNGQRAGWSGSTRLPSFLPLVLLAALFVSFASCDVETEFLTGDAVELRFSTDTLSFDTVFTARGSATRSFRVYNDGNQPVRIDRIRVEGRTGVNFIFNADGVRGPEARDVVVWGQDSIFVFVEVEVDPTEPTAVSPFIAEDRLVFETGEAATGVHLLAFGQNANYVNGFARGQFRRITCDGGTATFPTDLPTVIYGSLIIDSCAVQALAGTELYFHGGVQRNAQFAGSGFFNDGLIFTQAQGSLQLLGTREAPVVVRTDRLEAEFATSPAKYRGLIFGAGSRGNLLQHTVLTNAIAGITLDSLAEVTIDDSVIAYCGGPAVTGYQADVTVRNSLFHSNFGDAVRMIKGGNLTLEHTTVASYGADAGSLVLTNFDCDENGENCLFAPLRTRVRNSIIAGSRGSELTFLDIFGGEEPSQWNVRVDNSVVKTDASFLNSQDGLFADFYETDCMGCVNVTFNDPLFVDLNADDYQLDSLSVARDLGVFLPTLPRDLLGTARPADAVDAGAYEYVD